MLLAFNALYASVIQKLFTHFLICNSILKASHAFLCVVNSLYQSTARLKYTSGCFPN